MLESGPAEMARICRAQAKLTADADTAVALLRMAEIYDGEARDRYRSGSSMGDEAERHST
jgi:hypothetical protein